VTSELTLEPKTKYHQSTTLSLWENNRIAIIKQSNNLSVWRTQTRKLIIASVHQMKAPFAEHKDFGESRPVHLSPPTSKTIIINACWTCLREAISGPRAEVLHL